MDAERWERVEQLSYEALRYEGSSRDDFLSAQCGDDIELRAEVDSLVAELETDSGFLAKPLVEIRRLAVEVDLIAPETFAGPYRLVRPLGRGGMGEVFLAQSVEDEGQTVAVKIIRRGMDSEDVVRRFRAERRILSELRHPNIAQLYNSGVMEDGRPYYVMEYVDGQPIDVYCDEHRLPVSARLALFLQVCGAVQHAHQNLVVHRDLKPGNILIDEHGAPKLLDFGIAKVLDPDPGSETSRTRTEVRVLTPDYAAPEQLVGGAVTAATDCYGLGVLLHVLLTGRLPERVGRDGGADSDATEGDIVRPSRLVVLQDESETHASLRATEVRALQRKLRGDLDTIVLKALHGEPGHRYPFAQALADDVQRYLQGRPVLARPDTLWYRSRKFLRRNAWATTAAAATVTGLTIFLVQDARRSSALAAERDRAVEVRDFLLEAFGASGADQSTADTLSARQLLDRQASLLEEAYADRPRLRAEMLGVLAEGYQRLGLFDQAEGLARRSLEERRNEYGMLHGEVAAAERALGWIRHEQGAFTDADSILESAVAHWRRLGRGEREGLARALNDHGVVVDRLGRAEEAAGLLEEALDIRTELHGTNHRSVAVTASNLAASHYRRGDYEAATRMGERALAVLQATVGPDHQRSFVAQSNLAVVRWVAGDREGAAAEYRDLLSRQQRVLGEAHPVALRTQQALASFYEGTGRPEDAVVQLEGILAIREQTSGPAHPDVAETLEQLGATLVRAGRPDAAVENLLRALEIKRAAFGESHEEVAEVLGIIAEATHTAGRTEESLDWYRASAETFASALGADHPRGAALRLRLASALYALERYDESLSEYLRTEEIVSGKVPETSATLNTARLQGAAILLRQGRLEEAEERVRATECALEAVDGGHEVDELLGRLRASVDSAAAAGARGRGGARP